MQSEAFRVGVGLAVLCPLSFVLGVIARRSLPAVALVLCVLVTILFLWLMLSAFVPEESGLTIVRGRVVSSNAVSPNKRGLTFRLDSFPHDLEYGNTWPNFEGVRAVLTPGREITVWLEVRKHNGGTPENRVWRIDKDNHTIVGYHELAGLMRRNARIALSLTCVFGLVSLLIIKHLLSRRRRLVGKGEQGSDVDAQ